jgi:ubiquinone/menaquinone biosynthesis C-methylase UbiE
MSESDMRVLIPDIAVAQRARQLIRATDNRRDLPMDHLKRITDEFTRQAQTFDAFAEKTDANVETRFRAALGSAGSGNLLDIACGPGVVTAAIAPGAASVVAFDATEEMLEKARARCAKAGLQNVRFKRGDAERLPFDAAQFDGLVTRLAVHHFADPQRAFDEMFRVLRPGGTAVIVDVVSFEDARESNLHELEEWLDIVNDAARADPVRTVIRALAEAGRTAGMGLRVENGQVVFFHRWRLVKAVKPLGH